jgi:hypothetical protein
LAAALAEFGKRESVAFDEGSHDGQHDGGRDLIDINIPQII